MLKKNRSIHLKRAVCAALSLILLVWLAAKGPRIIHTLTFESESIANLNRYDPKETIHGVPSPSWLPPAEGPVSIPREALRQAQDYAETNKSAVLMIAHNHQLLLERHWRDSAPANALNSMSMAKTVLALAIGIAIDEGHLNSEDDPASRYFPEWSDDIRGTITVKQLLQMSSGLKASRPSRKPWSSANRLYQATDSVEVVLSLESVTAPGLQFEYNNANSQILSIMLKRATGRRYAEYLSEKLWKPIGASDAAIWLDRPGGVAKSYCCLFARPRDWLLIGELFLNQGKVGERQVVSGGWIQKMLTTSPLNPHYGYHIWLGISEDGLRKVARGEPYIADEKYYLKGTKDQMLFIAPRQNLIVLRMGEKSGSWEDLHVPNLMLKNLIK